jgi:hypothetical protein
MCDPAHNIFAAAEGDPLIGSHFSLRWEMGFEPADGDSYCSGAK